MGSRSEPRPAAFKRAQRADLLHLPFPHIAQTTFSSTSPSVSFYPYVSFSSPSCYSAMQMHLLVCPVLPKKPFYINVPRLYPLFFSCLSQKAMEPTFGPSTTFAVANVFNWTFILCCRAMQLQVQALMVFVFPIFKSLGNYSPPPILNSIVQKYLKVSACIMINRQIIKAAGNRRKVSS